MVSCVWLLLTHLMIHDGCSWSSHHICIPAVGGGNSGRATSTLPKSMTQKSHTAPLLNPLSGT